jgi:hypothetical protein
LIFELPVTQKIIEKKSPKDRFKAESASGSLVFVELFSRAGKIQGNSFIVIKKMPEHGFIPLSGIQNP